MISCHRIHSSIKAANAITLKSAAKTQLQDQWEHFALFDLVHLPSHQHKHLCCSSLCLWWRMHCLEKPNSLASDVSHHVGTWLTGCKTSSDLFKAVAMICLRSCCRNASKTAEASFSVRRVKRQQFDWSVCGKQQLKRWQRLPFHFNMYTLIIKLQRLVGMKKNVRMRHEFLQVQQEFQYSSFKLV